MLSYLTCGWGSGDGLSGERTTSSFWSTPDGSEWNKDNNDAFLLFVYQLFLRVQFGWIFRGKYRYWRLFSDFLISHLPQEAPQPAPTGANEPQLQHLTGCRLEFRHNMVKYYIVPQHHIVHIPHYVITIEQSSL